MILWPRKCWLILTDAEISVIWKLRDDEQDERNRLRLEQWRAKWCAMFPTTSIINRKDT